MITNEKSLSELATELESITVILLCRKFGDHEKGLGFSIVILAGELEKGRIGSRIPRSCRTRSYVSWQARLFAEKHNRNPNFTELLALVA